MVGQLVIVRLPTLAACPWSLLFRMAQCPGPWADLVLTAWLVEHCDLPITPSGGPWPSPVLSPLLSVIPSSL